MRSETAETPTRRGELFRLAPAFTQSARSPALSARRLNAREEKANLADVAVFSGYYPPHAGGIELVCADLIQGLCELEFKVNWVALEDRLFKAHPNCTLSPLKGTDLIYRRSGVPFPLPRPSSMIKLWSAIRRAKVIVIAEANFPTSIAAFLAAKMHKKSILLVQHLGAPSTVSRLARAVMRIAEILAVRPMLRAADEVVYVSPVVAKHFDGLRTRRRPGVIGHGVDTHLFAPSRDRVPARASLGLDPDAKVACFAGRCTVSKGIEIVIRMAELRPDWQFVIAGEGPIDPAARRLPNLKALGQVDRATLANVYRASDVLVLPSRSESFSLVVREALASGLRVLCGDQILETDPSIRACISVRPVDLEKPEDTARAFAMALDQPDAGTPEQGRAYVIEHCSWDRVFRSYASIIEKLAGSS